MKKIVLFLCVTLLFTACSQMTECPGEEHSQENYYLYGESKKQSQEPIVVAKLEGSQVVPQLSEEAMKAVFTRVTSLSVQTVSIDKVQQDYYLHGNDGVSNWYFNLELMVNDLRLLSSYKGCSGCGYCILSGPSSCSCNNSGSCTYSSGSVK